MVTDNDGMLFNNDGMVLDNDGIVDGDVLTLFILKYNMNFLLLNLYSIKNIKAQSKQKKKTNKKS